ncbi:ABC transporter substrate-binding protein [Anaerobacillus alkaliphilus]|uniref:ABC transporter substrate-binding protein n=1 Tax=Anaerobacillus alkaliphilus TaxID=1548597 RepID=A0A4Q0VYL1_9BACI|nr:ABC transporter substrate-binding protein [Anaerobacillus alkaliphilus]RXJ04482.1 ABC transporter substrate-binding protein [Anaerobacillus alkaliphilus]
MQKGYSSLENKQAIIKKEPFEATWITVEELRAPMVQLQANKDYWNKPRGPKLSEVIFRNDLSKQEALLLCINTEGQVDIVTMIEPKQAAAVIDSPYANLVQVNTDRVFAGVFNRFQPDVPFNDRRVREAFNMAINQSRVARQGFLGYATPIPSLVPPWSKEMPEDVTPIPYNPSRAKELLREVGWPEDREFVIAVLKMYEDAAKVIAEEIETVLSLKVRVIVIEETEEHKWRKAIAEKRRIPKIDLLLVDVFALFTEGIPAFIHREFFGENGALRLGPELEEFNRLFVAYSSEINDLRKVELAKEIDRFVYKEALGLFLCCPQDLYAVNRHVQFRASRSTFELTETEVTKDHWSRRL